MSLNMSSASGSRERRIKLNSFWLESSPPSLLPHHSDCLSGWVTNCNRVRFHLKNRNKFPVNGFTQTHLECAGRKNCPKFAIKSTNVLITQRIIYQTGSLLWDGGPTNQVFISLSFWEVKFSCRIEEKVKTKVPGKRVKTGLTSWSPGDTGTRSTLSSWAVWVRSVSGLEFRISSHTATNWRHCGREKETSSQWSGLTYIILSSVAVAGLWEGI